MSRFFLRTSSRSSDSMQRKLGISPRHGPPSSISRHTISLHLSINLSSITCIHCESILHQIMSSESLWISARSPDQSLFSHLCLHRPRNVAASPWWSGECSCDRVHIDLPDGSSIPHPLWITVAAYFTFRMQSWELELHLIVSTPPWSVMASVF